jgi:hypothetical protein
MRFTVPIYGAAALVLESGLDVVELDVVEAPAFVVDVVLLVDVVGGVEEPVADEDALGVAVRGVVGAAELDGAEELALVAVGGVVPVAEADAEVGAVDGFGIRVRSVRTFASAA